MSLPYMAVENLQDQRNSFLQDNCCKKQSLRANIVHCHKVWARYLRQDSAILQDTAVES